MRLKDKAILITASTRGIGLACVKACAGEDAIVPDISQVAYGTSKPPISSLLVS